MTSADRGLFALAVVGALAGSSCRSRDATPGGAPGISTSHLDLGSSDGRSRPDGLRGSDDVRGEGQPDRDAGSGCGFSPRQTGGVHLRTVDGHGASRDYEVLVPSTYRPTVPLALTFVYHGSGGTEAAAKAFGLQDAPGAAVASIFAFPQGIAYLTDGVGWDDSCGGYDMVFFDHMLDHLKRDYCVDASAVFAAGFSWGCDFVTALACCRGDRIRAIAAASCSDDFGDPANVMTYKNLPCSASRPGGIRFTHDRDGDPSYPEQDFVTTSALYRRLNSCSSSSVASLTPCVSYQGCAEPYIECPYPNLGHTLPATWPADTWNFFSSLR